MSASARELLRRYLAQRRELGEQELVLDAVAPAELRRLLRPERIRVPAPTEAPRERAAPPAAPAEATRVRPAPQVPSVEAPRVRPAAAAPAVDAPLRGVGAEAIRQLPTLESLQQVASTCPRCRLAETRQTVVFGEGDPNADVLVVGEAPGADEDRTGRPFVGRAGKLLDLMLASVGFAREQVFICNVLKCRPPGNRNPQPDEVEACSPYLVRQVELIRPRVIIAFGNFAAQTLLGTDVSMGKLRAGPGDLRFHDIPVVPTYHPAALLRNPGWVRATWDDLQRVRRILGG